MIRGASSAKCSFATASVIARTVASVPKYRPDWILSTVDRPRTSGGRTISTVGSRAVFDSRAVIATLTPTAMMPPRYSFAFVTAQRVVAVPKSRMTRFFPGYRLSPPIALAILSAPTSRGLRYRIFNPVFTPGSSTNGSNRKYFRKQLRIECTTSRTTEHMAASSIASGAIPFSRKAPRINIPNSSDEARMFDVRRNVIFRSQPSKTPQRIWLLPTSTVRSIRLPRRSHGNVIDQSHALEKRCHETPVPVFFYVVDKKTLRFERRFCLFAQAGTTDGAEQSGRFPPCLGREQGVTRTCGQTRCFPHGRAGNYFGWDEQIP